MNALRSLGNAIRLVDPVSRPRAISIGLVCVAGAAAARLMFEQIVPELLPFLFTFPAVIAAALVGGALAGWISLAGCQLLTLAFVLPRWIRDSGVPAHEPVNMFLATFSLALVIWVIAAYRAAARGLRRQHEREVDTLSLLANEADHRTRNNFQIAASLLHAQGLTADQAVRAELDAAAARLVSIAAIYENLSAQRPGAGAIPLLAHLEQIGEGLQAGLLPPEVTLSFAGDLVTVPASAALTVGLVVNEWITNAIKYAFPSGKGTISVDLRCRNDIITLQVRDDGIGLARDRAPGAGSGLLASLVEILQGRLDYRSDHGTICTLTLPAVGE